VDEPSTDNEFDTAEKKYCPAPSAFHGAALIFEPKTMMTAANWTHYTTTLDGASWMTMVLGMSNVTHHRQSEPQTPEEDSTGGGSVVVILLQCNVDVDSQQ
jgi:hypothetical protein